MLPVAHLYPWDVLGDPDAATRLVDAGIQAVNLAAAYHAVRSVTSFHPSRRVVEATRSARYVPAEPRSGGVWPAGGPSLDAPGEWGDEGDFQAARSALSDAGLEVRAWAVLTHRDAPGEAPDRGCVVNAFGEHYGWALCPSWPHIREYCAAVAHITAEAGPSTIVVEAAGQLGFGHVSTHDKTSSTALPGSDQDLLSVCFCTACASRLRAAGVDPDRTAARVRQALESQLGQPQQAATVEAVLGEAARPVLAARLEASDLLLAGVREAVGRDVTLWLHGTPELWSTAPWRTVAGPLPVDGYVVPAWDGARAGAARIQTLRRVLGAHPTTPASPGAPATPRIAAYVNVVGSAQSPHVDSSGLAEVLDAVAAAGAAEAHLYHLGLVNPRQLAAVAEAIARTQSGGL